MYAPNKRRLAVTVYVTAISILLFGGANLAHAQVDQGGIVGTVEDNTGAVVPGAKVSLSNVATGLTLSTTTQSDGSYTFNPIKIGTYNVVVEKQGFAKQ